MIQKAYAKINLGLNVCKTIFSNTVKHKIETIMMLIESLYDDVEVNVADDFKNKVEYFDKDHKHLNINSCLIKKTLDYLHSKFILKNAYHIKITKRIPLGAGIGGGSSDSASVIKMIFAIEKKDLKQLDYLDVALELGSDIPFFLSGFNKAYVYDFGDIVEELDFQPNFKFNIHLLDVNVHTKKVFDYFLKSSNCEQKTDFPKLISSLKKNAFTFDIHNVLQNACFELYPQVKDKFNKLLNEHSFCILTGSGSSLITIDSNVVNLPKIRTRYAPSPTGFFHIGGARTALYNYLFAKKHQGDFVVRIEDTDTDRNVEGGIQSQLDNLKWMGILPDESILNPGIYGPYIQSEKLLRYQTLAQKLLEENKAYRCFCTKEQLDQDRLNSQQLHQTPKYRRTCLHLTRQEIQKNLAEAKPFVIRLKIDDSVNYEWEDLIRGHISVPGSALTDPVILKSNQIAMYNFAVVVDDYDMKITHVLRGEEHISNTPYQLAIMDALGFKRAINYGHLSVIVDETGKKLSKRNADLKQFIDDYREMGFLAGSIDNFLALLGWAPTDNIEVFNLKQATEKFDLFSVSKAPTFFDFKKMLWIGNEHFKLLDNDSYLNFAKPFLDKNIINQLNEKLDQILLLFKNQISYATELNHLITEMFLDTNKQLNAEMIAILNENSDVVKQFHSLVLENQSFEEDVIKIFIDEVKKNTTKKGKNLFMPIRIATTRSMHGPELAKNIFLLGKQQVLQNIDFCLKLMHNL